MHACMYRLEQDLTLHLWCLLLDFVNSNYSNNRRDRNRERDRNRKKERDRIGGFFKSSPFLAGITVRASSEYGLFLAQAKHFPMKIFPFDILYSIVSAGRKIRTKV